MKNILLLLIFISIVSLAQTAAIYEEAWQHQSPNMAGLDKLAEAQADSIAPDSTGMRQWSSYALSQEMVPGWNVGNSLEAFGGETAWGNPKITQRLIVSVKAAGFRAIRIPVAWSNNMNTSTFAIDAALMTRVEEVVNYVLRDSMYAIINIHWDGGWMQPTYAQQAYVNNRLAIIWRQIAVHFRNYDDHLLFAGTKFKPSEFSLMQNYPNPFNPSTTITFSLPAKSKVSLNVFDVAGREIAAIVSQELPAGTYSRQWDAADLSSVIYFYRLLAGSFCETKRFILLR
jgi:aryl-phospho-beta-D-glucosidase BglC (GH1 family)